MYRSTARHSFLIVRAEMSLTETVRWVDWLLCVDILRVVCRVVKDNDESKMADGRSHSLTTSSIPSRPSCIWSPHSKEDHDVAHVPPIG
jgi:hypothetical protein